MKKSENIEIQKRVSLFVALIGFAVSMVNFILLVSTWHATVLEALIFPSFLFIFLFSLILFFTRKIQSPLIQYLQIAIFLINGALSLMDQYDAFHGMGFIMLSLMLAYRYGLLEKHTRKKLILLGLFTMVFLEFSISVSGDDHIGSSINITLYLIFFLTIIYLIYTSEINHILKFEKTTQETFSAMEKEKKQLEEEIREHHQEIQSKAFRIEELEERIEKLGLSRKPVDLKKFKITPSEEAIIREFCQSPHLTNKEIAHNLGTTTGTIKQYFSKIFKKMEVRSRQELLDKCKWNF